MSTFLAKLLNRVSSDLAIDLGTANTLVYARNKGIILNEPSVVAVQKTRGNQPAKVMAVGQDAKDMLGRTPGSISAIRPMKDGVIANFEVAQAMLKYFIQKSLERFTLIRPRIVISVPYGVTQVERRAVREAAMSAGAREVYLVEEPMAAAIGAGLPVTEPTGSMVVDIGGGTTEVAVISLGGVVYSQSVRIAGDHFDDAIVQYVKRQFNMAIGERTAESIKIQIGNVIPDILDPAKMMVKGRDLIVGAPRMIEITDKEVAESLKDPVNSVMDAVLVALERTPPELAADIVDNGIVLTGGGALLRNLDALLRERSGLPVMVAQDPLTCVVMGSGRILDELDSFRGMMLES